jgi:kynureninase
VPEFERVHRGLEARGVICDHRPDVGLRFGPHFFNTEDELRFAIDSARELAAARV